MLVLIPVLLHAQVRPVGLEPPPGKGRVVVVITTALDWEWERELIPTRYPLFLNDSLICRIHARSYTFFDLDTGCYTLAADFAGRKPSKNADKRAICVEAGNTLYFETAFSLVKAFQQVAELIPMREGTALGLIKNMVPLEDCSVDQFQPEAPFRSRKYFFSLLGGQIAPTQNYVTWWPAENRPDVTRFSPWIWGLEAGMRIGKNNHFGSIKILGNRQPYVPIPGRMESSRFDMSSVALFYGYTVPLDKRNRILVMPKAGLGLMSYVYEERSNTGAGFQTVGSFSYIASVQAEYRMSRTFSVQANAEYVNGRVNLWNEPIGLHHFRMFTGLKVQLE